MADVWTNSMACHPRATFHTAGCCHLANSMLWFQSYVSHCRVLPPGECNGMSSQTNISHCRVLPLGEFTVTIPEPHCRVQLRYVNLYIKRIWMNEWMNEGCSHLAKSMSWSSHIAECKNSIRHIENRFFSPYFCCFLCSLSFDERRLSYRLRYTCLFRKCTCR